MTLYLTVIVGHIVDIKMTLYQTVIVGHIVDIKMTLYQTVIVDHIVDPIPDNQININTISICSLVIINKCGIIMTNIPGGQCSIDKLQG